jgi:hypothetical protein
MGYPWEGWFHTLEEMRVVCDYVNDWILSRYGQVVRTYATNYSVQSLWTSRLFFLVVYCLYIRLQRCHLIDKVWQCGRWYVTHCWVSMTQHVQSVQAMPCGVWCGMVNVSHRWRVLGLPWLVGPTFVTWHAFIGFCPHHLLLYLEWFFYLFKFLSAIK